MIDYDKVGRQIALLRKEKKLTGEKLAEALQVSAQAVSKWENGKCLPETALLPELARVLNCSIDHLLLPKELTILSAIYTDGETAMDVTANVSRYVHESKLSICVNEQVLGAVIESRRLKLLTVKYQIPEGCFYQYALQNDILNINSEANEGKTENGNFLMIGAYYGNIDGYSSVMQKMEHYEYFKWDKIPVNHETFPSNTATDETEYLTLIYLNASGIHVISCAEEDTLYYEKDRTLLYRKDNTKCILPGIERLAWEQGMECPWGGALHAALSYMGETYTYEQIMGMSGACYRICFCDVWDWSCTDALVSFDYDTRLYRAIGYEPIWANRLNKNDRKQERQAIMQDLQNGKPVLAINLRVAPEWGVITGYLDGGSSFLCRTYFDQEIFDRWDTTADASELEDRNITFEERGGYLVNDFWPFLIAHFGEKTAKITEKEILIESLKTMIEAYNAENCNGYSQGRLGYEAWIRGLSKEDAFDFVKDEENVNRRLGVNESMLFQLLDARRCAAQYLHAGAELFDGEQRKTMERIVDNFASMAKQVGEFREHVKYCCDTKQAKNKEGNIGVVSAKLRKEQIAMLQNIMKLEQENIDLASQMILLS